MFDVREVAAHSVAHLSRHPHLLSLQNDVQMHTQQVSRYTMHRSIPNEVSKDCPDPQNVSILLQYPSQDFEVPPM
mgnify:CR=1 FL=1